MDGFTVAQDRPPQNQNIIIQHYFSVFTMLNIKKKLLLHHSIGGATGHAGYVISKYENKKKVVERNNNLLIYL